MNNYLAVSLGVLCAGLGGELFVRGAVDLGRWLRVPIAVIGATIAAFATSSPELAVALTAAGAGVPEISLGDALGSNVVNISLILALALLVAPIETTFATVQRDFTVALLTPIILALLAWDGYLSRTDGLILLVIFGVWLTLGVQHARAQRAALPQQLVTEAGRRALIFCAIGLALLVAAGRLIVEGAKGIATAYDIDSFIIGATVVAIATGAPELATTMIAVVRQHEQLGLGNLLGSNIFNGLLIVALAAIVSPITVVWHEVAVGLFFGALTTLVILPFRSTVIGRGRGLLLLATYGLYLVLILQSW
ncbi:MAG: calcium/sodium antiporter [Caldilineaceae bacterium]